MRQIFRIRYGDKFHSAKNNLFFFVFGLLPLLHLNGQEFSYKCKSGFLTYGVGYMMNDKSVSGYYYFTEYDKTDPKTYLYKLEIFDNNLKSTHIIDVRRPPKSVLVGVVNNGETFCVEILNAGLNAREFILYDKKGIETGSYLGTEVSVIDIKDAYEASNVLMPGGASMLNCYVTENVIPVNGVGYLYCSGFESKDKARKNILFDNSGKKKWEFAEPKTDKTDQDIKIISTKDFIVTQLLNFKGRFHRKRFGKDLIRITDILSGKDIFSFQNSDSTKILNAKGIFRSSKTNEIVMYGNFTGEKEGIFEMRIDISAKKIKESKYIFWKDFLTVAGDFSLSECIQDIIRLSNGKYYAYINTHDYFPNSEIKVLSTKDEAKNLLLSATIRKEENISDFHDFFILECDSLFDRKKIHTFKKDRTVKVAGYNYGKSFVTDISRTQWFIVHAAKINDKEEGRGYGALCVGSGNSDDLSVEKILLKDDPDRYELLPAKPGYVLLIEYLKKEDQIKVKLIKMDL